jgi:hypothetical protein
MHTLGYFKIEETDEIEVDDQEKYQARVGKSL